MLKKKTLLCGLLMILCGFSLNAAIFDSILDLSSELSKSGVEDTKTYEKLQKKISGINSPKDCEKLNEKDTDGFTAFQYIAMTPGTDDLFRIALEKYDSYMPYQLASYLNDPIKDFPYYDSNLTFTNFSVFLIILFNEGMSQKINLLLNDSRFNNLINLNVEGKIQTNDQSFRFRPLTWAIDNNNKKLVDILLNKNVEVNYIFDKSETDANGYVVNFTNLTPLLYSIYLDNLEITKALLNKKANINAKFNYSNEGMLLENQSPLFVSIINGDYSVFETIYPLYSDPASEKMKMINTEGELEFTPLHCAIYFDTINEAIVDRLFDSETSQQVIKMGDGNDYTAAEILLERNDISPALRNRVKNIDGEVKLFDAIENSDYEKVNLVLENGMNPMVYKNNHSAFELAVKKVQENSGDEASIKIVEDLLNHGAKLSAICSDGKTMFVSLILEAIDKGLDDTTRKLLRLFRKYNLDKEIPVQDNLPVLHYVVNSIGKSLDKELLYFLLEDDFKLNINQRVKSGKYNNWTPLLFAIINGNSDIVQFLIDRGAKVNIVIKQDESNLFTPLALALKEGQDKCANILLDNGASQTETVSVWGADKVSMLMLACASSDWSMVSRLLDNSELKINNFDSQGKNAFMYAAKYNKNPVKAIKILRNLRGRKAVITHEDINGFNAYTLGFNNKQDGDVLLWLLEHGVPFQNKVSDIEMYVDNVEYYNVLKEICDIKE